MQAAELAIIIVNWNGLEDTIQCLESLKAVTYPNYEIILVDNASTDDSVAFLSSRFPYITIIENEENLGFAEGTNIGIRHAQAKGVDYVLLLNNDTVVPRGSLNALVAVAESDARVGIVGPLIVYYDNPHKIWSAGGQTNLFSGKIVSDRRQNRPQANCPDIIRVDWVSGCALLIKADVIEKIGLLDKDYFLYLEDADWGFRAHTCGYISLVDCNTQILHKVGSSLARKSDSYYYYFARNTLLFFKKHGRWYHFPTFVALFSGRYGMILLWNFIRGDRARCTYIIAGIRDYLKGNYGIYEQ
jgi:GT2 family glycosyltransferase